MASILDKAGTNVGNAYKLISASPLDVRFVVADITERDSIVTANGCYAGLEVWVESKQKKYIAVPNGTSFDWKEVATTTDIPDISGKLDKTDYEWNKEIRFGSSGNLFIGSFPMYDSNVTVTISATTNLTYYGVLVLATQNAKKDNVGYYKATVYGDASNTVAPNIFIERVANSNIYNIYFKPLTYSKNLVHVQAAGLNVTPSYGAIAPDDVTNICTSIAAIPETATIKPTNALTSKFLTSSDIPNISITDTGTKPIVGDITSSGHTITVSRIGLDDLGLASAYKYKGSVAAYANLPATGNVTGDVWNVQTDGMNYAWTGSAWDALGGAVDLSGYTEGAASSTDNAIVRFDGTGGKKIQNSTVIIDDSGNTTLPVNATLKLNTYGTRFLNLSGNSISADMSNETGGWAGAFASVKDPSGTTTTMLGWYGSTSLTHIYMGGAYNDPYMKMTASGLFTFKNQVTINATQGTAPLAVASTTLNTNLNADLLDGKHASDFALTTDIPDVSDFVTKSTNQTITGIKTFSHSTFGAIVLKRNGSTNASSIIFQNNNGTLGSIGMTSAANGGLKRWSADTASVYTVWDSGNDGSGSGLDADLLDGKHASDFQLAGNYLTSESDTLQTVTNRGNTTTNIVKIQNGSAAGAFVLGADVNATTLTVNQRKLGRMGVPSYDSTTKTMAGISFDSQANVNLADFGGHPNNASSIAPDVIRFTVANTHDNTINGKRTLALQISKQDGLVDTAGGGTSVAAAKFFIPVQTASGIANTGSVSSTGGFTHSGLTEASGKTKNDYVLLAGGGTKLVSEIIESGSAGVDLSNYMPKTGGKFTGPISFQSSSLPEKSIEYITGIDGFADGGEMGWQRKSDFLNGYVAGTGLTADTIMLGNGSSKIKTSSKTIVTSITGSANVPTDSAVKTFVEGKGYVTTDTKNTAGSTNSESKLFLVGATTQAANPQTYSDAEVYTTAGQMNATSFRVNEKVIMQYNSTDKCLEFAF